MEQSPTDEAVVAAMSTEERARLKAEEQIQEQRLLRRLQMMMNLVMQTIAQDSSLSIDEASQMIADSRKAALAMFPGKELAYDLIWRPRFQRLMRERFRIM
jgi:protein-disulfide isomerase-like protein with CxxC motif